MTHESPFADRRWFTFWVVMTTVNAVCVAGELVSGMYLLAVVQAFALGVAAIALAVEAVDPA